MGIKSKEDLLERIIGCARDLFLGFMLGSVAMRAHLSDELVELNKRREAMKASVYTQVEPE